MADSVQTYKNHVRFFPLFHFVAAPITMLYFLNEVRHVWLNPNRSTAFAAVVAFGIMAATFAARLMALTVQDRVIRLEMRLRLARVLPLDQQGAIGRLTHKQLVALR